MFRAKSLIAAFFCLTALPALAQTYKIAVIGMALRGYLPRMAQPSPTWSPRPNNAAPPTFPSIDDYRKMLDETEPDIVWAFVENNRHLEILKECAPRHINRHLRETPGFYL
jgi:predicted dehydrogenase